MTGLLVAIERAVIEQAVAGRGMAHVIAIFDATACTIRAEFSR